MRREQKSLSERLARQLRRLRGEMTQREFAKKLGINQGSLNRIEQQNQNVTLKTLQCMCDRLRCEVSYLFSEGD